MTTGTSKADANVAEPHCLSSLPKPGATVNTEVCLTWRDPETNDRGELVLPAGLLPADILIVTKMENGALVDGIESNGRWIGQDELCQILDETNEQLHQQMAEWGDQPPPALYEIDSDEDGHQGRESYMIDGEPVDDGEALAEAFARIQDWEAERGRLFRVNLRAALRGR